MDLFLLKKAKKGKIIINLAEPYNLSLKFSLLYSFDYLIVHTQLLFHLTYSYSDISSTT